ncbi:MAG TPA: hypothetical protein VIY48_05000 [Candidatus Paceibacterota bacterium]
MTDKGKQQAPKSYQLDCGHVLWFRIPPNRDDQLWCAKCGKYEHLLAHATQAGVIFDVSGEFKAERKGKKLLGYCLHKDCDPEEVVEISHSSYYHNLQKKMHSHYMRRHTKWTIKTMEKTAKLPPNSPPPF